MAILSTTGFVFTAGIGLAQNRMEQPARSHAQYSPQPSTDSSSFLPASPWSRQVSYEQESLEVQSNDQRRLAIRPPARSDHPQNSTRETSTSKPAAIQWGPIQSVDSDDGTRNSSVVSRTNRAAEEPASRFSLTALRTADNLTQDGLVLTEDVPPIDLGASVQKREVVEPSMRSDASEGFFLGDPSPAASRPQEMSTPAEMSAAWPTQDMLTAEQKLLASRLLSMGERSAEQQAERMRIAEKQSSALQAAGPESTFTEPGFLESPVGWKAIRQELANHLETCDSLLRRGATHSARAEVLVGLRKLFRAMDLHRGVTHSETSFEAALTAMREEADFHNLKLSRSVASIVAMHTTPALKNRALDSVTTELACQHYRAFARYQMLQAADGHLFAADLLYALGKTLEKDAEQNSDRAQQLRSQAVICYQSAIKLRPNQHHAANQLGYALIHLDRIEEAYDALRWSIEAKPNAQAWTNLAEIYRRRGATSEAQYAVQQAMALGGDQGSDQIDVTQVDPATFARYSPALNANGTAVTTTAAQPAGHTAGTTPPIMTSPSAGKSGNFFTKMFR
ncbi:tetratricopeptide repeat protein [Pirellulaceae bacterium SH449]